MTVEDSSDNGICGVLLLRGKFMAVDLTVDRVIVIKGHMIRQQWEEWMNAIFQSHYPVYIYRFNWDTHLGEAAHHHICGN